MSIEADKRTKLTFIHFIRRKFMKSKRVISVMIKFLILGFIIFILEYTIWRKFFYKNPFSDAEMKKFCKEQGLPEWKKETGVTDKESKESGEKE